MPVNAFNGSSSKTTNLMNTEFRLELDSFPSEPMTTRSVVERTDKWHMDFDFFKSKTNPNVKPYKFFDDLTYVGLPIFTAGIIAKGEKRAFRQNDGTKHVLVTEFKTHIDDYLQFLGPVTTIGLKLCGVEGRSDWPRFWVSSAMTYGIMGIFVNSIKYTAKEMRPDGSTRNSWPSGHTATAFCGATILHKEYGLTRSPWYSVLAYTSATATGVMRVLNNRHWVSDILSGAGIGIMSGELAYAISDLIFKDKGLLRGSTISSHNIIEDPSFFSISMGIGFSNGDMTFNMVNYWASEEPENQEFHLKFGASMAMNVEGAYFFNKYVGVGGRLRVNAMPINGWDAVQDYAFADLLNSYISWHDAYSSFAELKKIAEGEGDPAKEGYQRPYIDGIDFNIKSDHLTEFAADLGVYFNIPLSKRFALGTKLLFGRSIMQEIDLNARAAGGAWDFNFVQDPSALTPEQLNVNYLGDYEVEWDYFTVGANNTMKVGTGLSLTFAYKDNYAWKLFADYDYAHKTFTFQYRPLDFFSAAFPNIYEDMDLFDINEDKSVKKGIDTWILGGSFTVNF